METCRTPDHPRRTRGALPATLLVALTCSCQSYEPHPLEPESHRAAWHARTLEGESLASLRSALESVALPEDPALELEDGLGLAEARLVARVLNPDLRLARLEVQRAAAAAGTAGLWSDPQLQFTFLRITDGIPDPWVLAPGLAFSIPLTDRLGAERDAADAGLRAELWRAREAEWALERDLRVAWYDWSEACLRVEEHATLLADLVDLDGVAEALVRAGELPVHEAGLVGLERARRAARGPRLVADRDAAEQRLRALIGLTPDAPVELVPSFAESRSLAEFQLEGDRPPVLRRLREEHEVAENELRAAILGQVPDLAIGPQYETDGGQRRIGLFGWWTVPLWNANRPAIAAARARRDLARAAYETEYERLVGRLEAVRARSAGIAAQRRALEDELLPRVAALRADTDRLVGLGEASAVALLQVLIEAQLIRLSLVETRAEESRALAELTHLVGPRPHPASTRP